MNDGEATEGSGVEGSGVEGGGGRLQGCDQTRGARLAMTAARARAPAKVCLDPRWLLYKEGDEGR